LLEVCTSGKPLLSPLIAYKYMSPEVAQIYVEAAKYISIGIMCTLPFALVAVAEGWVAAKAMEAMGRNPEAGDSIFTRMIVAMAICESTAIYTLVVTLILLFVL